MKCCILSCKNYSDKRSDAMNGITFHSLPSEENLRQQWIAKIKRQNWNPTKYTKICSCHFNNKDIKVTKNGLKKIKKGTLPCLKLDISLKKECTEPETSSSRVITTTNESNEFLIFNDSAGNKMLKQEIAKFRCQSRADKLKIRGLQMKVNRLNKKVHFLTALVNELEEKGLLLSDDSGTLTLINVKLTE